MLRVENILVKKGDFSLSADLDLKDPGIYALMGPSGSGKSSFLEAIGGFIPLLNGKVYFQDRQIDALPPSKREITNIFQSDNLFPHLTLRQNIGVARSDRAESIEQIATELQIEAHLDKFPHQVSGGQAIRAALARAFLQNHELWLLDEPFAALGPRLDRELRALIAHKFVKAQKRKVIFVSHQPEIVRNWADFVLWIEDGKILKSIKINDFFQNLPESALQYL